MPFKSTDQSRALDIMIEQLPQLTESTTSYEAGAAILEEGESNDRLFILIEGRATLGKLDDRGEVIEVDAFGPGSILGLTSFWSREKVFAQIKATTNVSCLSIDRNDFDRLVFEHPEFARSVQELFVNNLSDRYRNLVRSHVERARLSRELESERNHLRDTLSMLESATKRLINQEKLATMGQLLAGVAHEINNPIGALISSSQAAEEALVGFFEADSEGLFLRTVYKEGIGCPYWSTEEKSARLNELREMYPSHKRSLSRELAQMTSGAFEVWKSASGESLKRQVLEAFNIGVCLRSVRITGSRIETLVAGLKRYGKQTGDSWLESDLRDGIGDTLTVLNNRLKRYELLLDLKEIPAISCNVGEMNQVWTNLLVNAMDATEEGKKIEVSCCFENGEIVVRIQDSGSGIRPEKLFSIFEPNYTTKNTKGSFGLGLGLSISDEIVKKHSGRIEAANGKWGGALFTVALPV